MQMSELSRFIRGLQYVGWTDKQINQLILYIEEGGEEKEKLAELKTELENRSSEK